MDCKLPSKGGDLMSNFVKSFEDIGIYVVLFG